MRVTGKITRCVIAALLVILPVCIKAALMLDDSETGSAANTLGGSWITYDDGFSNITFTANDSAAYAGSYARRLDWNTRPGSADGPYTGASAGLNASWAGVDMSAYAGVRFYARGSGGYDVALATDQTRAAYNHYTAPFNAASSWQRFEIPFSSLTQSWGAALPWEPSTIFSVNFTAVATAGNSGQLWIDNIEFYTPAEATPIPDPNVIILDPKVNQLGYLPNAKKFFTVVTNTASVSDTFVIIDVSGNTAHSGIITLPAFDDRLSTGEGVFAVDFSALTVQGNYRVRVNGRQSHLFLVSSGTYDGAFKDALRTFYINRCGAALNDSINGFSHAACHLNDAKKRDNPAVSADFKGGWHNAGDFGKWTHMHAISTAYMLWLYELKKINMNAVLNNNIPESSNTISDILDEAKYGLDFLMKMLNSDGSVYHKVDTQPDFAWGTKPEFDTLERYASFQSKDLTQTPSTVDNAVFAAVMAQASRVYLETNPSFAASCRAAALSAWNYITTHPYAAQTDIYYTDPDYQQELKWAQSEIYRLNHDAAAGTALNSVLNAASPSDLGWMTPDFFAYFTIAMDESAQSLLRDTARGKIETYADSAAAQVSNSGYKVTMGTGDYYWGSNENAMHKANCLLMAYSALGKTQYLDTALSQLGYILGNNSLNKSFVTKHGDDYASQPYHWSWYNYGVLIPGWPSGGPNNHTGGADPLLVTLINKGTPPAKCWIDAAVSNGSWASNEGQTTETAAYMFLTGFFFSEMKLPDPQPGSPKENLNEVKTFPSPCDLRGSHTGITFSNLTDKTKISIYNLSGELVHKNECDTPFGTYTWQLKPAKRSKAMAPGVYIYAIKGSNGQTVSGKVAVIR